MGTDNTETRFKATWKLGSPNVGTDNTETRFKATWKLGSPNVGTDNTETRFKATWKLGSPMWGQTIQRQGSKQHGSWAVQCGDRQYRDKVQSNMEARQSNVGTDNTETRFKATWNKRRAVESHIAVMN